MNSSERLIVIAHILAASISQNFKSMKGGMVNNPYVLINYYTINEIFKLCGSQCKISTLNGQQLQANAFDSPFKENHFTVDPAMEQYLEQFKKKD